MFNLAIETYGLLTCHVHVVVQSKNGTYGTQESG